MTLIALLFLGCFGGDEGGPDGRSPDAPSPPGTDPAAEAPSGTVAGSGAPGALLTDAMAQKLTALPAPTDGPSLCAALPRYELLADELAAELEGSWAAMLDAPDGGASYDKRIADLGLDARGFAVTRRAEGMAVDVDYVGLGARAGVDTAMFEAARPFVAGGFPPFMQQETDVSGCVDPMAGKRAFLALARTWPDAEPCLQNLFRENILRRMNMLGTYPCYCHSEAQTLEDIGALKPVLVQLTDLQGPAAWAGLQATAKSESALFGGGCSG